MLVNLHQLAKSLAPGTDASDSSRRLVCRVPECNGKAFPRQADLDRHTRMLHDAPKTYACDYLKCSRSVNGTPFNRQDHFRDHLRDQHKEDLLRRSVRPDADWWNSRSNRAVSNGWWRCSRCLMKRVVIDVDGYSCPGCGNTLELERQKYREKLGSLRS
ncbi:hypothetical protein B0T16DRAFT_326177 [Cercophora newfieldiana]|uniref:C2H2-type domain-containing protein n=1 Tax=Cercophora newfieldiana TaxID=92897 RepID=A0AA40CQZ6_9PEZI|nr:hypothetical protein B0T16DRAFT_326177 [Cercophora newfieldiana]